MDFQHQPVAADESKDLAPFWRVGRDKYKDPGDEMLPSTRGFITDLVYEGRGCEAPTSYVIWSGLYALASVVKRQAYIPWMAKQMYSNFYAILVGTAGLAKKSTSILKVSNIMRKVDEGFQALREYIEANPDVRRDPAIDVPLIMSKRYMFFLGKTTVEKLAPENRDGVEVLWQGRDENGEWIRDENGHAKRHVVPKTSEIAVASPELSMLLGRQKYNEGMIPALLELYDPHDVYTWSTVARGDVVLKELHTTFIGGTTIEGFKSSVSETAIGDGFISRCALINEPDSVREFWMPSVVPLAPDESELAQKLAWIAYNTKGAYEFSPKAQELCRAWYHDHKMSLRKNLERAGARSRIDTLMYKLALLMRIQEYDRSDNIISDRHVQDALRIINYTYRSFEETIAEVAGEDFSMYMAKVRRVVEDAKEINRKNFTRHFTRVPIKYVDICLSQLVDMGSIAVVRGGIQKTTISKDSAELYVWKGDAS